MNFKIPLAKPESFKQPEFSVSSLTNPFPNIETVSSNTEPDYKLFYEIDPSSWYKTFPFAFEIKDENEMLCRFFLPIPPQNYTIQDMSSSEAHATIGGVVEEVSSPTFSMITLVGTTGLSVNSPGLGKGILDDGLAPDLTIQQRKMLDDVTGTTNPLGKILKGVIDQAAFGAVLSFIEQEQSLPYQEAPSAVNTPKSELIQYLFRNSSLPFPDATLSKLNPFKAFETPRIPVNEFTNGWAWSQALRQFFLIFQRERAKNTNLQLWFSDHKSRTSYRCVPRSIQFQQNANNPYIINYTIILKCWDLTDSQNEKYGVLNVNRFNSDLAEVNTATFTGAITNLGKTVKNLNRIPSIAGSFVRNSVGSFL